ncbi:hypothetical protein Vafri_13395 [Volvox africanus]|nr:hypothetical protein Vafri_13395 [Volvox africanus]
MTPWLSVDLGNVSSISKVVLWNRCDCCWHRLENAELRIGNVSITEPSDTSSLTRNPLVWKQQPTDFEQFSASCASLSILLYPPKVGRWVTLQNKNGRADEPFINIYEVQVFAGPFMVAVTQLRPPPPPPSPPAPSPPPPSPPSPPAPPPEFECRGNYSLSGVQLAKIKLSSHKNATAADYIATCRSSCVSTPGCKGFYYKVCMG